MSEFYNDQWRLPNNENKDKQSNYSMDFDGSSQYVSISNSTALSSYSISCWVNADTLSNFTRLVSLDSSNHRFLGLHGNGTLISGYQSGSWSELFTTSTITTGTWNHIVLVDNGTNTKIYVNTVENTLSNSIAVDGPNYYIGSYQGTGNFFNGKIDGVSIFNYALSASQITTLYGSSSTGIGNPMSLSPKPVAFYQIGDKSAFNGANYLVPNIAAQEADGDIATSFSPYSLDFDGTNDYIDCNSFTALNSGTAMTVSLWFKGSTYITNARLIRCAQFEIYQSNAAYSNTQGRLSYKPRKSYGNPIVTLGGSSGLGVGKMVDGQWHHICLTFDNSTTTTIVYEDGISVTSNTTTGGTLNPTATNLWISSGGATLYNSGSISNVSVWNTALTSAQVTEIYSEGIPQNLNNHSAYSNLVSWWQLGSNSSFNTNWTVLDEKGSNNGTSVNMDEVDIVDGVGSYANGLSSGMGGDEVIGDAPYSTANALSVNMDVLDRVEDTPS